MFATLLLFILASIFWESSPTRPVGDADDQPQAATWRSLSPPLSEVRWGLIGCGSVTEVKSGPALSLAVGSKLVHVMRRNATAAEDYAKRHDVPAWSDDAESVLKDPEVNAIYIATPPRYHADYAIRAAAVGKAVYVEKPAGRNAEETKSIDDAFKAAGLPLFVAYYRRALPNFRKVKELMETGVIGEVVSVHVQYHRSANRQDEMWKQEGGAESRQPGDSLRFPRLGPAWRTDPEVGGTGGYLRDKGSHQIDLLEFFFGPIVHVAGSANNTGGLYPTEDMASATFDFASGVKGTASWCFICSTDEVSDKAGKDKPGSPPPKILQEYGEIEGTRGRIRFQFFLSNVVEVWTNDGNYKATDLPSPKHIQEPLIQAVVNALRGERSTIGDEKLENGVEEDKGQVESQVSRENWLTDGESATRTSHILDMIVKGKEWTQEEKAV
eukprot:TRINITY_DN2299_c0_g1_i2.p1 TRINITY_DN2299_c0_g1~~TRINITY_DN2299_c0_g1_i2.p1  ORF type:complete len:448 (-),score=93.77 TRINITY_DN2299_c0_g1_i2:530-1852(-)